MKKILTLCLILISSFGFFLLKDFHKKPQNTLQIQKSVAFSFTPIPTVTPAIPLSIQIPAIRVNATIESVGLDSEKRMDIPKKVLDVGWYDLGVRPGDKGNAVIDGHFDTQTGAAATFYDLKLLKPGDTITITDLKSVVYHFIVSQVNYYPTESFPVKTVFGPTDNRMLQLITCAGIWDRQKKDYSKRLVISATFSPEK